MDRSGGKVRSRHRNFGGTRLYPGSERHIEGGKNAFGHSRPIKRSDEVPKRIDHTVFHSNQARSPGPSTRTVPTSI
jgi:hypothetical protein